MSHAGLMMSTAKADGLASAAMVPVNGLGVWAIGIESASAKV